MTIENITQALAAALLLASTPACGNSSTHGQASGGAGGSGGNAAEQACLAPLELFCNGACLDRPGQQANGCTELTKDVASGMAVTSAYLYYSGATSIERLDLTSLATLNLVEVPALPTDIVVDTAAVYFDTELTEAALGPNPHQGTVRSVPLAGGSATVLAPGLSLPMALTLVGSTLYFGDGSPGSFSVKAEPLAGGTASTIGVGDVSAFAVDGATLYYAPQNSQTQDAPEIDGAPLAGPLQSSLVAKVGVQPSWLSSDADYVYFAGLTPDSTQTEYGRVAKADNTVETLRTSATPFVVKGLDANEVYILEVSGTDGDRLLRVPRAGGADEVVAPFKDTHDMAFAVDATSVYVGTGAGVVRLAK